MGKDKKTSGMRWGEQFKFQKRLNPSSSWFVPFSGVRWNRALVVGINIVSAFLTQYLCVKNAHNNMKSVYKYLIHVLFMREKCI